MTCIFLSSKFFFGNRSRQLSSIYYLRHICAVDLPEALKRRVCLEWMLRTTTISSDFITCLALLSFGWGQWGASSLKLLEAFQHLDIRLVGCSCLKDA